MPKNYRRNIADWKKLLPDYEFVCWSEENFNVESCSFTKDARDAGKWAFVADYVRLYALFNVGGIYLDTDVEVVKSFDLYLDCNFFSSFEDHHKGKSQYVDERGERIYKDKIKVPDMGIISAIMGGVKNLAYIKDVMSFYHEHTFDEIYTNRYTIPTTLAYCAEAYGFRYIDSYQELEGGIKIYPTTIFSNYDQKNQESVAVHYCAGSWHDSTLYKKIRGKLYRVKWLREIVKKVKYKEA